MASAATSEGMSVPPASEPLFRPPGPSGDHPPSFLEQLRAIKRPIDNWPRAMFTERVYKPPVPGVLFVMDPATVRAILVDHADDFPQGALMRRLLRPVWGDGMVIAQGAEWRWQRRAAAPAFRAAAMTSLAPRMRAAAETALARWGAAPAGSVFDIAEEARDLTFDIILDAVLSGGDDLDRATASTRIHAFMAELAPMKLSYFFAPDAHHEGRDEPRSDDARALLDDVDRMIARRRTAPPRGDLLDMLMTASDPETGRPMDDAILRDNLMGFIVAGHETSAVALAWALYLTSQDTRTADRICGEVAQVTGGGAVEAEHVERLVYTRQVVQETLRLYPSAHSLTRVCARTVEIEGVTIRRGSRVVLPIYAMHRHEKWWRDPNVFDPDRFAAGEPPPDRHLYMPFGAGPRICIGAAFAMTELVVVLATLVRSARFSPLSGHRVWPIAELALRPEGGLPMRVRVDKA